MKIAVLTSGGVDSSVALKILKDQGHNLTAFYLKIWLEDELSFLGNCPWEEDLSYVRKICRREKIPLKIIPLQKEYFETVVKHTIDEVRAGRTPNPDIMCNNHIKFGLFLKKLDSLYKSSERFEKIATGHYAQVIARENPRKNLRGPRYILKKSPDPIKDQTYFLSNLSQKQLARLVFPIGHLTKKQVRELAERYDLPNKNRKDSQGICFLGKLKYEDFVKYYLGTRAGDIIEHETGQKLGQHEGFWYYTIGQRRGIKLSGGPWFVVKKHTRKNLIFVSKNYHSSEKKRDRLEVKNLNFELPRTLAGLPRALAGSSRHHAGLRVKLRHGPHSYSCKIKLLPGGRAVLKLDSSDQGIAAGQFAAFYSGKKCLGSGIIC